MRENIKLARKNLLRNKRRTMLTSAAFGVSMILTMVTNTIMKGSHEKTIEEGVKRTSGHIQIHYAGYQENPSLYNSLELSTINPEEIGAIPGVRALLYRITAPVLSEAGGTTSFAVIRGVDPEAEKPYGGLASALTEGEYLSVDDSAGVYVGKTFAESLGLGVGSELFFIGQSRDFSVAAGSYRIRGIFRTGNTELDKSMVLMNLSAANDLFMMHGFATEAVVMLDSNNSLSRVEKKLQATLSSEEELIVWKKIIPELNQFVLLDAAFGYLFSGILIMVVIFGVVNTILTAILERRREFAVLLAIGASPRTLFQIVSIESFFLSLLSVILGAIFGILFSLYFVYVPFRITGEEAKAFEMWGFEPVIYGDLSIWNILGTSLFFLIFGWAASLWPAWIASKTDMIAHLQGKE